MLAETGLVGREVGEDVLVETRVDDFVGGVDYLTAASMVLGRRLPRRMDILWNGY